MIDEDPIVDELIAGLRKEIDDIDELIIKLVRERTFKSSKIVQLKKRHKKPLITGTREAEVYGRYARALGEFGKTIGSALLFRSTTSESDKGTNLNPMAEDSK